MASKAPAKGKPTKGTTSPTKASAPRGGTGTKPKPAEPVRKPTATYKLENDPTLRHPLQGMRVTCTVLGDPQSNHKKTKTVVGKLTAGGTTVIFIDYMGYWASNVQGLKEKK